MKARLSVITSIIFLFSLMPYVYAQDVSQPEVIIQKPMPPEPPQIGESVKNDTVSEDSISIQTLLKEFYARNVMWYFIVGSIASLAVAWKLTPLRLIGVSGIFITLIASYLSFPPLCQTIMSIFRFNCGTDEQFFSLVPFSVSLLVLGIILLFYSYKSKKTYDHQKGLGNEN